MGGEQARRGAQRLRDAGVPVYDTPEAAVLAFSQMRDYRRHQESLQRVPADAADDFTPDVRAARRVLENALGEGRDRLTDPEGKALLAAYGVAAVHTHVALDADQAA